MEKVSTHTRYINRQFHIRHAFFLNRFQNENIKFQTKENISDGLVM